MNQPFDNLTVADVAFATSSAIRILVEMLIANGVDNGGVLEDLAHKKADEMMFSGHQEASLLFRSAMGIIPD